MGLVAVAELDLLITFAIVLIGAEIGSILFQAMRLPRIVGMIVAGILIGPHVNPYALQLGLNPDRLSDLAFLGGIFLMFSIGLTFNIRNFQRVGGRAFYLALVAGLFSFVAGFGVALLFNQTKEVALFVGLLLTPTSSAIGVRLAQDQNLLATRGIDTTIAGIILDDVTSLVIATVVLGVLGIGARTGLVSLLVGLMILLAIASAVVVVAMTTFPRALQFFERVSGGQAVLPAISLAFFVSFIFTLLGLPPILGAFWSGSIIASSRFGDRVEGFVRPVTDMFSAIFFTAFGMLLDPWVLPLIGAFVVTIVIVGSLTKFIGGFLALRAFATPTFPALVCSTLMIPRGEISLIIAQYAGQQTLVELLQVIATVLVMGTTLITPLAILSVRALGRRAAARSARAAAAGR